MFECDLFELLNADIRKYCDLGDIFLTGDLNARTREILDFTEQINLDRCIYLPEETICPHLPLRKKYDKTLNRYGKKLFDLVKENSLFICNGRLEEGKCTYHALYRNKPVCSLVDYVITSYENLICM